MGQGNTYDAKDQIAEMMYYYRFQVEHDKVLTPEQACRDWVVRFAKKWRDLKNSGTENPSEVLRAEYVLTEDQYKWASGRHRRAQVPYRSKFTRPKTRTIAEQLDEVFRP